MSQPASIAVGQLCVHETLLSNLQRIIDKLQEFTQNSTTTSIDRKRLLCEHILNYLLFLHDHHWHEENILFPALKEKSPELIAQMDQLCNEHADLLALLDKCEKISKDAIAANNYEDNMKTLHAEFSRIQQFCTTHFGAEDTTFTEEVLDKIMTRKDQKALENKIVAHAAKCKPELTLSMFVFGLTPAKQAEFSASSLPWIVRSVLIPWVWYWSYKAYAEFYPHYPF